MCFTGAVFADKRVDAGYEVEFRILEDRKVLQMQALMPVRYSVIALTLSPVSAPPVLLH